MPQEMYVSRRAGEIGISTRGSHVRAGKRGVSEFGDLPAQRLVHGEARRTTRTGREDSGTLPEADRATWREPPRLPALLGDRGVSATKDRGRRGAPHRPCQALSRRRLLSERHWIRKSLRQLSLSFILPACAGHVNASIC